MTVVPIVVPDLGEQISRVRVVKWFRSVGDAVAVDETVVAISTEKIDVDVTAPITGTLASIDVAENEHAAIGATLGSISA